MVKKYRKGYIAELGLVHKLSEMGYMTIRAPRSGRINIASPDVVAVKNGKIIVIECKSRKDGFNVKKEQLNELKKWSQAGAKAYIGWRLMRKGWLFLKLSDVIKNKGNVGKKFAKEYGITMEELF